MSGSMRSATGLTAGARSRSAGMPPGGLVTVVHHPGPGGRLPGRAHPRCPQGPGLQPGTGEPASWATRAPASISWLEHAAAYAAMKWPLAAAHTRAGIADALATITPALLTPGRGRPPAAMLRAALYRQAFNPARADTDPGPAATAALDWARHHCLPLTALAGPQVTRRALDALTLRLDGTRAAAATITRKRAVFHGCLGYAAELGLLEANPPDRITWKLPRSSFAVDPRSAAPPPRCRRSWPRSPRSARN